MRLASIMLALVFTAGACGGHPKIAKDADQPAPPDKPLYDRLGGTPGITAVVEEFVTTTGKDPRIAQFFINADIPRLKKLMVEQICQNTGGPCHYTGKTMKESHKGLKITDEEFNALVEDLKGSLDQFKVPAPEQNDLIGALAPMKPDIVNQ